jgi:uracil-DNA glycosylase
MSYWPWGLNYWNTGEWQVCHERLKDLDKAGVKWNPPRKELFQQLRNVRSEDVKVLILGQDPYPKRKHATGIPFRIPPEEDTVPPTLATIFEEYESDTGFVTPEDYDILPWLSRGVLPWNVVPTCTVGESLSHQWEEYYPLTWEILDKLSAQPLVVASLGGFATKFLREQDYDNFSIITVSHPSPRASKASHNPFLGSKIFTRINTALQGDWGLEPIDWNLSSKPAKKVSSTTAKVEAQFRNETQEYTRGLP